jgi:hypothetical protein
MASLIGRALATRAMPQLPAETFGFQGVTYPTGAAGLQYSPKREGGSSTNYERMFTNAMAADGPVAACMLARRVLLSEARFKWRRQNNGRPGALFGERSLRLLETPWPNGSTSDLIARMEDHAGLAGNAFVVRRRAGIDFAGVPGVTPDRLAIRRPDWFSIVMGSYDDPTLDATSLDAEVIGYLYWPGGVLQARDPVPLLVEDVAHYAPHPDPLAFWRGMSWLTPLLREIGTDLAATEHKARFFENGATPQLVVVFQPGVKPEQVTRLGSQLNAMTRGPENAYKTLYLGGGADVHVVGKDLAQLDFTATQGRSETRIAMLSGIHPAVLGMSEGLQGASLNAGNFSAARRLTADKALRPAWRNMAAALSTILDKPTAPDVPGGGSPVELWYDDRDIPFLREDLKDVADAQLVKAQAMEALVRAGFDPASARDAIDADDLTLLSHTGLVSVQLHDPSSPPVPPVPESGPGSETAKAEQERLNGTPAEPATGTTTTTSGSTRGGAAS